MFQGSGKSQIIWDATFALIALVAITTVCQRRTGAAFGIGVFFPADHVEFIGLSPKTFEHRSEEHGRWLRLDFCRPLLASLLNDARVSRG
jgi:hypothetical protein